MEEIQHPMDGFDVPALRGMLDRFEDALRDARHASLVAEGLADGTPARRDEIEPE